jgi:chromosome segregation protein
MHFNRMKIAGFKSFVEPTEFPIEPGLTGVVGPNGCGKSNVVESLRWSMGENSAKRLRGSEMDDVIFSGSAGRPARNLAEVTLILDNRERTALAEFNADDVIEVTRRIERGMGSDYRINGRPVRQKDVQLLFADQATGAHSTSIVSQGRVSALISAKPEERRQVLEEAAGVSGLHARRHEAELKLKAAEANLARVGDQLQGLDQQLRGLKTQVRQTSRYRNLGELIRKAEAGVLHAKITEATMALKTAEESFHSSETKVHELTSTVAQASTQVAESAAGLPPLRQNEAAASAVVQRLFLERETLEREAKRIAEQQESIARRIAEVRSDEARETELKVEAEKALESLAAEKAEAEEKLNSFEADAPALAGRAEEARTASEAQEKIYQEKAGSLAASSARLAALTRDSEALNSRAATLASRIADAEQEASRLQEEARGNDPAFFQAIVATAESDLAKKQGEMTAAQEARRECDAALSTARAARDAARAEKTKLDAEIEALRSFLAQGAESDTPVSRSLNAKEGYEAALGAALGESMFAPLDNSAKTFWQDLSASAFEGVGLPDGAAPLAIQIEAPEALKRALSLVGVVENEEEGDRLSRDLKPGQILVTREGAFWRWDGYTQRKDADTPTAIRLKQQTKLTRAERRLAAQAPQVIEAEENLNQADLDSENARRTAEVAEHALQAAFQALNDTRRQHNETLSRRAEVEAKINAVAEGLASARADHEASLAQIAALEQEKQSMPTAEQLQAEIDSARQVVAEFRAKLIEAESAQASFESSLNSIRNRLKTMTESEISWKARAETGAKHLEALSARLQTLEEEGAALASRPAQIEEEKQALLTKSNEAEETRRGAADALLVAEQRQQAFEREMRAAEEALMSAKESRVRFEEQMYRAKGSHDEFVLRIKEHWHCAPEELAEKAELDQSENAPALEQIENDLARYTRERENMGPVNLRAEIEAGEIEAQVEKITADKTDLEGAIAKLRQGISSLNREARERLETAFKEVDKNFTGLFERLFGGGKAFLKLIESDDPLEAGLEIYASPPGKRMQVLSLLSGGEQALTALSLLFAIFMVNPSPICVLDEVDAPLDEANVDRFCTMVREMSENGKTRFIVVTHHRLTMARMDRLFGVTMAEKGVSQLVSVDLKQALALREQQPGAATASYAEIAAA